MSAIEIDHYSDVLCVWAYVAHVRNVELQQAFGNRLHWDWHYLPVFGHTQKKFADQWADRGGVAGYAEHVSEVLSGFEHVDLHPDTWRKTVPTSSAPAHLWLCGARLAARAGDLPTDAEPTLAWAIRCAFFQDGRDISQSRELSGVASALDIDPAVIESRVESGEAFAALCDDMQSARDSEVRVSPTFFFNNNRQRLTGNVGYRIVEANIRELIDRPSTQHSWC